MTIKAKIIADSVNKFNDRITTFELEYPRFIHAELMTHRVFSRNSASSRAIPVKRAIELIREDTAMPIHWGKNQPGMSAKEECNAPITISCSDSHPASNYTREQWWMDARDDAIVHAEFYNEAGYHKQIVNRLLEPFTHIKVVCTATEFDNWFWLRCHPDAQPEIQRLAEDMYTVYENNTPKVLTYGSWHVPYYMDGVWVPVFDHNSSNTAEWIADDATLIDVHGNTLSDALAVSSSCSAQVSYRKLDDSVEKARSIFKRLVESMPPHFSPFEHQATPMPDNVDFTVPGVTHLDKANNYWSGNFKNWIQHRQLLMEQLNIESMTSKPSQEILNAR